jgi:haloalkane dehalogenase
MHLRAGASRMQSRARAASRCRIGLPTPMTIFRTDDERFEALPAFPFRPRYVERLHGYPDLRMHYVDEGQHDADIVFVCLHGQPTWGYLYRRMAPVFLQAGARVVIPDMFGFGRSDKPGDETTYTFDFHRGSLIAFIETLDLRRVCLVVQDWGGLLGLTLPMAMPDRITRLLIMNTTLGTGDEPLSEGFLAWRDWANKNPDMPVGKLLGRACPHLGAQEIAAYDAPYPDARYKAGVRRFPNLVPDRPDAPGAEISRMAREWLRTQWSGESTMAIGMRDPVLGADVMHRLHKDIRGCPAPLEVGEAGHFTQEWGERIATDALSHFVAR